MRETIHEQQPHIMRIACADKPRSGGAECVRVPGFWYFGSIRVVSGRCPKVAGEVFLVSANATFLVVCGDGTFLFVSMFLR